MVIRDLPKVKPWVRFPSPAQKLRAIFERGSLISQNERPAPRLDFPIFDRRVDGRHEVSPADF